jgi:hypothetical protein
MPLAASAAEDAPCRPGGLPAAPSAWLAFTAPADLLLAFDLLPVAPEDDLDFVLYELPEGDCDRRRPLRCTAAGPHIVSLPPRASCASFQRCRPLPKMQT